MRTINRAPYTVSKPKQKIKYNFFNHYNWKGLNTNKNYFDIDQETFEDCQDVYMDENGVLKSRPSVKLLTSSGLQDVVDQWIFGEIRAYKTTNELHIVDNDNQYTIEVGEKVKLLMFDNKLLIFTPTSIQYYKDGKISDGTDLVYVPETTIYTNGVRSTSSETKNLLTSSEITTYLYNNVDKINNINISNKFVDITINNDTYSNIRFVTGLENVLFSKKYELAEENYSPNGYLGDGIGHIPMISAKEYGGTTVTVLSSVTPYNSSYIHKIYYSVDNILFKELPEPGEIFNLPQLAVNEPLLVVIKSDGLYCISLIKNDIYTYYDTWTKFYSFTEDSNEITLPEFSTGKRNYTPSLYITDITRFVCMYASVGGAYLNIQSKIENATIIKKIILSNYILDGPNASASELFLNRPFALSMKYSNGYEFIVGKFMMTYDTLNYKDIVNFELVISNNNIHLNSRATHSSTTGGDKAATVNYINTYYDKLYYRNECIHITEFSVNNGTYTLSYKSVDDYVLRTRNYETRGYYSLHKVTYNIGASIIQKDNELISLATYSYNEYNFVIGQMSMISNNTYYIETEYANIDNSYLDKLTYIVSLNADIHPIYSDEHTIVVSKYDSDKRYIYSNNLLNDTITIKVRNEGKLQNIYFDNLSFLNVLYGSIDNTLYISENKYDKDGNLLLYFSDNNKHTFNSNINNLHPISSSQIAVFFDNEIWYTDIQTINDMYVYTINKSKLGVGCKYHDDIVTTFDGKYVIFPSQRGLVAMGYQDFVASTEQTLTYLSDTILDVFSKFSKLNVKLYLYKYWLVCYNSSGSYLFDFRNNSWWYFKYNNISKIITIDDKPNILANGKEFVLDTSPDNYYDDIVDEYGQHEADIEWFLVSQKLHLGTLNYHKHILNISFNSLQESEEPISMKLNIKNYRINAFSSDEQHVEYKIDVLRTFVKHLNYLKVNQFQYRLSYDYENYMPIPLCIDNISIKYNITGQVR